MRFGRIDSRETFAIETPIFIARQADSPESLEFPIRATRATKSVEVLGSGVVGLVVVERMRSLGIRIPPEFFCVNIM